MIDAHRSWSADAANCLKRLDVPPAYRATWPLLYHALTKAPKFFLPDGGRILHLEGEVDDLPPWRLPFPQICIEFHAGGGDVEYNEIAMPRRLVVAWEDQQAAPAGECPKVAAWPIDWRPEIGWVPSALGAGYDPTQPGKVWHLGLEADALDALKRRIVAGGYDFERWFRNDVLLDTQAVQEMALALACRNVSTSFVAPPKFANRKRVVRGELPIDGYHVLTLGRESSSQRGDSAGDKRSPRTHLRRGHIRRLESGPIWINSTIVNPSAGAKLDKAYRLTGGV